jgi:hypothetical protein
MNSCTAGTPLSGLWGSGRTPQSNATCSSYLPLPLSLALLRLPRASAQSVPINWEKLSLPPMSPASGALPRGVACRIKLKPALQHPLRGPGLQKLQARQRNPTGALSGQGGTMGGLQGMSSPSSKLTYQLEHLPPGGQCTS